MAETTEQASVAPDLPTEFTEIEMRCPPCNAVWSAPVARRVNVRTHPDARLGILLKTIHWTRCPVCKQQRPIDAIFEYFDPDKRLLVQVRPEWEYHAGGGEDWYWTRYEDLVLKYQDVDIRVDVVFGLDQLIEKFLGGEDAVRRAREEWETRQRKERSP
ncbi:CpXC domain-containing protein [Thermomicrobium sp. CFH 73360]|uniref:CpXC domain-containing protein n=1 Tax=Thermomicrobium sp. CFH 73360 TaxID=2951987 RepID=UPI0020769D35|nr:CpXC domain-containing protein [Thermomicrobium sp. CFH 73360]MCM8745031.1 CpXC domain-containing protein [Thermomicrobium sp. CFH 73360]